MNKSQVKKTLFFIAAVFYIVSVIMLYKGYDKMANYYNSEYSTLLKNAYVGGDAYNYIINGNYATGFFVLSAGFMISGTVFLSTGQVIEQMNKPDAQGAEIPDTEQVQLKEDTNGNSTDKAC